MIKKMTTLTATLLACLTVAGCVSEGGSYRGPDRVHVYADGPARHYRPGPDRRDWNDGRRHHSRDDRRDRRDWNDHRRGDRHEGRGGNGRFVIRDGYRVWVPNR